jgi:hypothetical protein
MKYSILFKCNLTPSDILITYSDDNKYVHNTEQAKIEAVWLKYIEQAKETDRRIWDAVLYRLAKLSHCGNKIHLHLGSINVKEVLAAREGFLTDTSPDNLFVTSLLKTSDDLYLFGRKSITSQNNSEMIGGTLSRSEIDIKCGSDILKALYNEFDEETNIKPHHVLTSSLLGIIRTQIESIGLIWESELSITSKEAQQRFDTKNDGEIKELAFVPESDLKSFLKAQNSYLPLISELVKV